MLEVIKNAVWKPKIYNQQLWVPTFDKCHLMLVPSHRSIVSGEGRDGLFRSGNSKGGL